MAMERPAFPTTLPTKQLILSTPVSRPSQFGATDQLGTIKVILGFLIFAVIGNIALTIYMTRPKDLVEESATTVKANAAMEEIDNLKKDLARTRNMIATGSRDLGRLKAEYLAVAGRLAAVTTPRSTFTEKHPRIPIRNPRFPKRKKSK